MKELNLTEAQLRSWRPRRPAAGLKQKIATTAPVTPAAAWWWRCLAPATACVWLTMMAFTHNGDGPGPKPMMSMILSNQSYAAYAAGAAQTAQNHLAAVTFDWTNHSSFKSIIGFTPTTNFIN